MLAVKFFGDWPIIKNFMVLSEFFKNDFSKLYANIGNHGIIEDVNFLGNLAGFKNSETLLKFQHYSQWKS